MVLQWAVLFLMARTVVHGQGGLNFECLPAQEVRLWTTGGLLISIPGCVGKQNMASPVTITFSDCSNMEMEQQFTVWAHKYQDFYSGSEAQSAGVTCALNRSDIDVTLGSTGYLRFVWVNGTGYCSMKEALKQNPTIGTTINNKLITAEPPPCYREQLKSGGSLNYFTGQFISLDSTVVETQKVSENDQELLQSHTAVQHREEEPQNIYSNNTQGGQSRGQSDWVHGLYELVIGHHSTDYPDVTPVGVVSPTVELAITPNDDCSGDQEWAQSVDYGESFNLCLRMTADYATHYGTRFLKVVVYIEGSGIERTLTDQGCSKGLIAASDWSEQIMMAHGTSGKLLAAKIPFNVFLLVGVDPKIFPMKLGFRVTAERCYGECGNVTCPPPSNRKRRSADELGEDFEPETVTTSLTVNMNRATDDDINGATDGDQNEQKNGPADDVCINKGGFYGLLTFMAVSLLIAVLASAFMFMRARKSRMPLDERDSYYRDKNCAHNPAFRG